MTINFKKERKTLSFSIPSRFLAVFLLYFAASCSKKPDVISIQFKEISAPKAISENTKSFSVGDLGLEYYKHFAVDQNDTSLLFFGYNGKRHSIDLLDLRKINPYLSSISLNLDGPDGVSTVEALSYNKKTLDLFTGQEIIRMNLDGDVLSRFRLTYSNAQFVSNNGTFFTSYANHYFLGINDYRNSKTRNPEEYYKSYVVGKFDTLQRAVDILPIPFSKLYQENNYGFMDVPLIKLKNSQIWITFPISDIIYCYSLQGRLISKIDASPLKNLEVVEPIGKYQNGSTDRSLEHFIKSNSYHQTIFFKDYIVRPYRTKIPDYQVDVSYPMKEKSVYLSFLNMADSTIFEYKMTNNNINTENHFSTEDAIWFQQFVENEGQLNFRIVSMEYEEEEEKK